MATPMTNHEIEAELRKVLKITLSNDLPSECQSQTSTTKDQSSVPPDNYGKIQRDLHDGRNSSSAVAACEAEKDHTAANLKSMPIGMGGIYSLTEIECGNDVPFIRLNDEKALQNLTKKKKRSRKVKLADSSEINIGKLKSELSAVVHHVSKERSSTSNEQDDEKANAVHSVSNNVVVGYDKIFCEKTIQNLTRSSTATEMEDLKSRLERKSKRNKKNKSSDGKDQPTVEKLKNNGRDIFHSLSPKDEKQNLVENSSNSGTSSRNSTPKIVPSNNNNSVADCDKKTYSQSSTRTLRNAERAAYALDRLNLAMLDKSPPDLIPYEVAIILEQQHIFPLKKKSAKQPKARFLCHLCDYHCNNLVTCKRHIQSSKHHSSVQNELLAATLRQLPIACDDQLEAIEKLLESIYESKSLKEEDIKQRQLISEKLAEFCKEKLPENCEIKLFGSSVSQLGLVGCDANINLFVPTTVGLHPGSILKQVHSVISEHPEVFNEVKSDYEAKLPSIYFKLTSSGTNGVVGINNTAALQTSELLRDYAALDRRVKVLCVALRHWAKICQIDRQSEGTLPPHTFDIMVIYFLQRLSPPVLPVLCDSENMQLNQKTVMANWSTKNWMSVSHLWVELFRFYALTFPASGNVICIRKLTPIPTSKKNWRNRIFSVEDPFMTTRNLTRNVSSQNINDFILNCFKFSFKYFGIPQTEAGPLFDYIDLPLNHAVGNNPSDVAKKKLSCLELIEAIAYSEFDAKKTETNEMEQGDDILHRENSESMEDDVSVVDFGNDESSETDLEINEEKNMNKAEVNSFGDLTADVKTESDKQSESSEEKVQIEKEVDPVNVLGDNNKSPKKEENSKTKPSGSKSKPQNDHLPTPAEILELIKTVKKSDYLYRFLWKAFTGGKFPAIECSVCHKQGHVRKDCPEETLPPLRPLPPMTSGFLESISIACIDIHKICSATSVEWKARENLLNELQTYIRKFYPDAIIELFGSSCNGFGFKNSDLDICLTFKGNANGEGINYVDVIMNLAEKLKQMKGFATVIAIPTAKVPIVKFLHTKAHLECDISLYNILAKCNTRMLLMYSQIDPRVAVLGFTMKYFAKLCDIGDASRGSLSSYAYTLMVLYFLQQRKPSVIPVLQELCEEGSQPGKHMIDGWNAWYYSSLENLDKVWPHKGQNTETVGELWLGLLKFYTEEFNFKENVICIRQQKVLTRFEKLWNSKCIAIEDPFDLNHNLGTGVSSKMSVYIRKTFIKGREVFGTPINALPNNFRSVREFLFDPRRLVEGPPPNDRGCRVCGKIGHMVRECPRKKGNIKQPRKLLGNNKSVADQLDKNRADLVYKGAPLVTKRPIANNQQQQPQTTQQQHLANAYMNLRAAEPGRLVAPNFNPMANPLMRPPLTWNSIPRPFIQPNLNQRVPMSYVGNNSIMNRLPGPFAPPRPPPPQQLAQPSNIRAMRPLNVQLGNTFLDHRHPTSESSPFKP